jgi:hypothetical protein
MPSGQNPCNQLLSSNRRRSKGDLGKLQVKLWFAIETAEAGLKGAMQEADSEEVRRWVHVISQLGTTYIKAVLDGDIEERVKRLENARQ